MIEKIRKNIGTIAASFGFFILGIATFGDLADIMTDAYWASVRANLTSIGIMTVALTMIQVVIKQGFCEQALQKGLSWIDTENLNTEKRCDATLKFDEHREIIKRCSDKQQYISYFLEEYNERNTATRKRDFLADNDFKTEEILFASKKRFAIWRYKRIRTVVTTQSLRWATTTIKYDKRGRIVNLSEYRSRRAAFGIVNSLALMLGVTLLTRGLFIESNNIPLYQKFIKLFGNILVITVSSIFPIIREYEKGKFGVPNELDAVNEIWAEFEKWTVPEKILQEALTHERNKTEDGTHAGTGIQTESQDEQNAGNLSAGNKVDFVGVGGVVLLPDDKELNRESDRDNESA